MQDNLNSAARERAFDKIRKLLSMARDGRGNEHEAAVAAGQAEKLMRYYQIEAADVVMEEIEKEEAFTRETENVSFEGIAGHCPKQVPNWVGYIAVGCGKAFTCKVDIVNSPAGLRVRFSGYAMDVMLAKWVYAFLCETVFRISKERCKGQGMSAAKSFRVGAAGVLQRRLEVLVTERKSDQEQQASAGQGTALALYDRKAERVEEMFGSTKTKQTKTSVGDRSAFLDGQRTGQTMSIPTNRPLDKPTAQQRLN
jgi:hypothetical protein